MKNISEDERELTPWNERELGDPKGMPQVGSDLELLVAPRFLLTF